MLWYSCERHRHANESFMKTFAREKNKRELEKKHMLSLMSYNVRLRPPRVGVRGRSKYTWTRPPLSSQRGASVP